MARQFAYMNFVETEVAGAPAGGYVADRGRRINYTGRFVIPPDLTGADVVAIATAAGATGDVDENTSDNPCPVSLNFSPRKLVFIRKSGNSLSVPIGERVNIDSAKAAIQGVLDAKAGNETVCIKLIGEEWLALNDELGLALGAAEFAVDSRPAAGDKQYIYSGVINYNSDVFDGAVVFTPVKVATGIEDAPPANVAGAWAGCVGAFISSRFTCGRGTRRDHRRYIVDFRVGTAAAPLAERKEVPVAAFAAADILTCGTTLAALTGAFCISYQGESFSRVPLTI